jgi:hypothetical protein
MTISMKNTNVTSRGILITLSELTLYQTTMGDIADVSGGKSTEI